MGDNKLRKFLFPTQESETNEINYRSSEKVGVTSGVEIKDLDNDIRSLDKAGLNVKKTFRTLSGEINGSNIHTPSCYVDADKIACELKNRSAIIVNLETVLSNPNTKSDATRIIDYLCGVAWALDIEVKAINTTAFYFSPNPIQK